MRLRILLVAGILALFALPVLAQESNSIAFNGFSFSLPTNVATNISITQFAGDPTTLEQPGGPEVKHTQFVLYNGQPAPESLFDGVGGIRVYRIADFNGYEFPTRELENLQALLAQRPDLSTYMAADTSGNASNLPFMPVLSAAQVIRARAHYVDGAALSGVSYVTVYRQDVSPFVAGEFYYTFQGLSSDSAHYVSAIFKLNTTVFPAEIPADFDMENFNANFATYLAESIANLNNATPENFTPSLTTLDGVIASFAFSGVTAPPVVVPTTAPVNEPTPMPTSGDTTMGGLAGVTWTLTDLNGQPALPDRPVTLVFSQTGVTGDAGCNSFGGDFQFENNSIRFGQLVHTLMACEEAVNTQEAAFLDALSKATTFQLSGSQLQISYDGGILTFSAS